MLEWYQAKFLKKLQQLYNNSPELGFLFASKLLNRLRILVAGGGIEPPTLGL